MGTATTFAELIANPVSEKVVLVECEVRQEVTDWVKTPGYTNVYQTGFLFDAITLMGGVPDQIRKIVSAVKQNGAAYAVKTSIAEVDGTASTFYHAVTAGNSSTVAWEPGVVWEPGVAWENNPAFENGVLYVHTSTGAAPTGFTMIISFYLLLATKGISLNGSYYEPYVSENGIPRITQRAPENYGVTTIGAGTVNLVNANGYFDQISRLYLWTNGTVRILLGGDLLPYSEYQLIFRGKIIDPRITSQAFSFSVKSIAYDLLRTLPTNRYTTATYPNLDPAAEGKPIPILYGTYTKDQAPLCTCIDSEYVVGVKQVETLTVAGGPVTVEGTLGLSIVSARLAAPYSVGIPAYVGNTASDIATALREAVTTTITDVFDISGTGADVVLTAKDYAANDSTLLMTLNNGVVPQTGITVPATSVDTTAGVRAEYQFKICDTSDFVAINFISGVYVDYGAGDGWQPIAWENESTSDATFTLSGIDIVVGKTMVKAAFSGKSVPFTVGSSGCFTVLGAPEICGNLLQAWCGAAVDDFDEDSFVASMTASSCGLNVPIENEESVLDIIGKICRSDSAYFGESNEGKFRYVTWAPYAGATPTPLTEADIWDVSFIPESFAELFASVSIGYGYNCETGEYLTATGEDADSAYKYGKNEALAFETYLRSSADASALVSTLLSQTADPPLRIAFSASMALIEKQIGDVVAITLARSPNAEAGGQVAQLYTITSKEISCFPAQVRFEGRKTITA
ncbi:MAG: hypothetical protein ACYC7J_18330 [Syntrophales bacterium]